MNSTELANISEVTNFLNLNSDKTLGGKQLKHYYFNANVNYRSRGKSEPFETSVRVATDAQSGSKISLGDHKDFEAEEYHLDFEPRYQDMRYDQTTRCLIISGDSPKMGGGYTVSIQALSPIK